jgi:hypothetical protein
VTALSIQVTHAAERQKRTERAHVLRQTGRTRARNLTSRIEVEPATPVSDMSWLRPAVATWARDQRAIIAIWRVRYPKASAIPKVGRDGP